MSNSMIVTSEEGDKLDKEYINIPKVKSLKLKSKEVKNKKDIKELIYFFKDKFYQSELAPKKGEEVNRLILKNYPQFEKKTIYKSLIGQKPGVYDHIRKAIRFWEGFCNYSFPIILRDKFAQQIAQKKKKENIIKLPQLYTNSSQKSKLSKSFNQKANCHIHKSKSSLDIFVKHRATLF